ncbi:MAG TPA: glutaminase A, partial [Actinomycetospora sp.]|nr:glutaminase A [Actinomycetospora sp.]
IVSIALPAADGEEDVFGLAGTSVDGTQWTVGDCEHRFPLQSISKIVTYALALEDNGREAMLRHVGVEPSGDPFNSITFDDEHQRPHNPMINAGALVAAYLVHGDTLEDKVGRVLGRLRAFTGVPDLEVDGELLADQLASADRNLAISYLMRSLGMITGSIEDNLAVYLSMCSVRVNTCELSALGATLANGGVNPVTGERALDGRHVRDVVSVMMTCGMYDAVGEWTTDVGIPAKSGVSGGIVAVMPGRLGLATFSPGLDAHGNPVRGQAVFRELSARYGLHMFATPDQTRFGRLGRTGGPRLTRA